MDSGKSREEIVAKMITIINNVDVDESNLKEFDEIIHKLGDAYRAEQLSKKELQQVARCFGDEFLENTIQGYGLRKPMGYPGDYLMIDKIYTRSSSDNPRFRVWDEYFHNHPAPKAVRNRKEYFKKILSDQLRNANQKTDLLDVASGPGRDLLDIYKILGDNAAILNTTCVDIDDNAIDYAKSLLNNYNRFVAFHSKNILRFSTTQKFDIVWSAGLFDYFSDRVFKVALEKFKRWTKPGGEIIIGNFNKDYNPSRDYMEIFGEWYLIHRSVEELTQLAKSVGFSASQIEVHSEPENVNLFLHIRMED